LFGLFAAAGLAVPGSAALLSDFAISAIDAGGQPVPPLITVPPAPGVSPYELSTGPYATGPFVSSLEFRFTPSLSEPNLLINFSYLGSSPDVPGTDGSSFLDAFVVSLYDGVRSWTLFTWDKRYLVGDPYGTAPHTLTIGPAWPYTPLFQYGLNADLSPLANTPLILAFDIINVDDGSSSRFRVDSNLRTAYLPIPEPLSGLLLLPVALAAVWLNRRNQRTSL
jgi:hypothetical protein